GRRHEDHALVGLEPVHLDQQLVERLFAFIVTAAKPGPAMTSHRVDLVDENDTRRMLLALHEQVAHARRANANEHLDKVRSRDRKERHARFACDRPREQRLAGSRRPDQQHALGNSAAQPREALGVAQKLNYLFELVLGLVDSRHVAEGNFVGILSQQFGAALAERHRLAAADLHLAHEENPQRREHYYREPLHQRDHPPRIAFDRLGGDLDALFAQGLDQVGILGRVGLEMLAAGRVALDQISLNRRLGDLVLINLVKEVRENYFGFFGLLPAEDVEQHEEHQSQHQPQCNTARKLIHAIRQNITRVDPHATWQALSRDFRRLNAQYGFGGPGDERTVRAREPRQPRDFAADRDDREALPPSPWQLAIHEHVMDLARATHPHRVQPVALHKIARDQARVRNLRSIEDRNQRIRTIRHRRVSGGGDRGRINRSLELETRGLDDRESIRRNRNRESSGGADRGARFALRPRMDQSNQIVLALGAPATWKVDRVAGTAFEHQLAESLDMRARNFAQRSHPLGEKQPN